MIVECRNCGAPLEVERGHAFAQCSYCGRTNKVKSARTLMAERPASWQPPPTWTPPAHVPAPSDQPLPRSPTPASAKPSRGSSGCWPALFIGGFVTLSAGVPILLATGLWVHLPLVGIDVEAEPTVARIDLSQPSPGPLPGTAESDVAARSLGDGCRGYLPRAPQVTLRTTEPGAVVLEVIDSGADLVLAVHTAQGAWLCDDDSGEGTLPRLRATLAPGEHQVFVGAFHDGESAPFSLTVQAQLTDAAPVAEGVTPDATPSLATVDLSVAPPSGVWPGQTTGWVEGRGLDASCRGSVPMVPHLRIRVPASSGPRAVRLVTRDADEDLVMAARTPSGRYVCDDDSGAGLNPRLDLELEPGDTAVWVGPFHGDRSSRFTLELGEPGRFGGGAHGLRPDAAPAVGTVNLDMDEWSSTFDGRVRADVNARRLDPACRGHVGAAPDLVVLTTIDRDVTITAEDRADLTLIVRGPSGALVCDDDSGEGRDPSIRRTLRPGAHQVWVGAFRGTEPDFRLRLTEHE
ncbi:MAG TPA: hypothetical protein RMH99_01495 [Sandaracinaceae bacterium LLY-WYZ-13_1]|nr:hypothetical protein [Sandaracinaceae bacterium LLY-WYZ-13_1]